MYKTWQRMLVGITLIMSAGFVSAADTIKVGVLHSLSGTMAISETTLKDTILMLSLIHISEPTRPY